RTVPYPRSRTRRHRRQRGQVTSEHHSPAVNLVFVSALDVMHLGPPVCYSIGLGTRSIPPMRIELPDGSVKQYEGEVTPLKVAQDIGPGLAKAAVGAKVDGQLADLTRPITRDAKLSLITQPRTDKAGRTKGE